MRLIRYASAVGLVAVTSAATVQAAPVTVGSPLTQTFEPTKFNTVGTVANIALPEPGAHLVSPTNGAVVAWHIVDAEGGPFRLRVLRPVAGGYLASASSAPMSPAGLATQTFTTALPVQAGDLIGIDNSNAGDKIGVIQPLAGAKFAAWVPPLGDGASAPPKEEQEGYEVGFNAVVQPPPTLSAVVPNSGSFTGGTAVTITGTDFANVTGVKFGGLATAGFAVDSEGQITAVAPAGQLGEVDVTVTTIAGTTPVSTTDRFSYAACVVPSLKGRRLKAAKKRLRKANCQVGKVTRKKGVKAKAAKVVRQGPKPSKQFPPGKKVNVRLG